MESKFTPEERRKFFDQMLSLYSQRYFDSLRSYRSILAQRNAAIRSGDDYLISLYNNRLATYGMEIMEERAGAVYEFNKIFPPLYFYIIYIFGFVFFWFKSKSTIHIFNNSKHNKKSYNTYYNASK